MAHLPKNATDEDLIRFIDRWVELMEQERYEDAFAFTSHRPEMGWSAVLLRDVIIGYGDRNPKQTVTLNGILTDTTQQRDVRRWPRNKYGEIAEIWYDLNVDGLASDLTAIFRVVETDAGLEIILNDIHVM